jgi:hypothetical protein
MRGRDEVQVYLIENGRRRWIPDPETLTAKFGGWDGVE